MPEGKIAISERGGFYPASDPAVLVVLLHAFNFTPKSLQRVAEVVREEFEQSDIYAPLLPVSTFSCADPDEIAAGILRYIDDAAKLKSYQRIILVGHSLGAVMARKVWALAHGATPTATIDSGSARGWADKIDRIVLLAATNRGWMISSALDPFARLQWTLGTAVANLYRHLLRLEPTIFAFRRGAPTKNWANQNPIGL